MFRAPYSVDNAFFRGEGARLAPHREEIRRSFGITDAHPVVLFAGKLIPKKQPLRLLDAFASVRAGRPCSLLIAGDGPLRSAMESAVRRQAIPDVHIAGFLNQHELPRAYVAADVFALPSNLHETWGLVVNEAMNFGLPVVVSDRVGCADDLVQQGENGMVVHHDDTAALARSIASLVDDEGLRRRFGAASRARVARYSIEATANGIVAACTGLGAVAPDIENQRLERAA
jgi:glycosyltransferase involved in cell wall biosynthesis